MKIKMEELKTKKEQVFLSLPVSTPLSKASVPFSVSNHAGHLLTAGSAGSWVAGLVFFSPGLVILLYYWL